MSPMSEYRRPLEDEGSSTLIEIDFCKPRPGPRSPCRGSGASAGLFFQSVSGEILKDSSHIRISRDNAQSDTTADQHQEHTDLLGSHLSCGIVAPF